MASGLDARHLGRADFILGPDGPVFLNGTPCPVTASSLLLEPRPTLAFRSLT